MYQPGALTELLHRQNKARAERDAELIEAAGLKDA